MSSDQSYYGHMREGENTEIEWRWSTSKKIKFYLSCMCLFLLVLVLVVIFRSGKKAPNCSVDQSSGLNLDFTALGKNGWVVFLPYSVTTMMNAQVQIILYPSEPGNGTLFDSPTLIMWNNGATVERGSSTSYALFSSNVTIDLQVIPPNMNLSMSIGLIVWCSNCTIHGPGETCVHSIQNQWSWYRVDRSGSHVILTVEPLEGQIYIQGIYV